MDNYIKMCEQYLYDHLKRPEHNWPVFYFKEQSYARATVYHIICILQTKNGDPIQLVTAYMNQMELYSKETENPENRFMFATAMDTASNLLIIFGKYNQ